VPAELIDWELIDSLIELIDWVCRGRRGQAFVGEEVTVNVAGLAGARPAGARRGVGLY
jgi:hypothetical protein